MRNTELCDILLNDVAATSLITLYSRALASVSNDPIINDPNAIEIMQVLNSELSKSKNELHREMTKGNLDKQLIVRMALRARRYDQYVQDFLRQSPDGIIVDIGCGFDTRFYRIDNGKIDYYDLDFPEVITIKKRLLNKKNGRYHFIPSSVLRYKWMEMLFEQRNRPIMFIAEGVFIYLYTDEVRNLVLELQSKFPGSEIVCEVLNSLWLEFPWKIMLNFWLRYDMRLGKDISFNFGIRESKEMENWNSGIEFLDDWTYIDEADFNIVGIRLLKNFEIFRKIQWTVHYKLN